MPSAGAASGGVSSAGGGVFILFSNSPANCFLLAGSSPSIAFIISPTPPPVFGGAPASGGLGVSPPGDGSTTSPPAGATYGRSDPPPATGGVAPATGGVASGATGAA